MSPSPSVSSSDEAKNASSDWLQVCNHHRRKRSRFATFWQGAKKQDMMTWVPDKFKSLGVQHYMTNRKKMLGEWRGKVPHIKANDKIMTVVDGFSIVGTATGAQGTLPFGDGVKFTLATAHLSVPMQEAATPQTMTLLTKNDLPPTNYAGQWLAGSSKCAGPLSGKDFSGPADRACPATVGISRYKTAE